METWSFVVLSMVMISTPFKASAFTVSSSDFCYAEDYCYAYAWEETWHTCHSAYNENHSPINLNPSVVRDASMPALLLAGYDQVQTGTWTMANTRDTIVVEVNDGMTVGGANLPAQYKTVEMRFHWGSSTSQRGSEHTFNKIRYPMEMQIMSVLPQFSDVSTASNTPSGVAAIAFFIDIGASDNAVFEAISSAVRSVPHPGDSTTIAPFALLDLIGSNLTKFYRYPGGITTPPCTQNVEWTVFQVPLYVSHTQFEQFATGVYYGAGTDKELNDNYRHVQSSGARVVTASADAIIPTASAAAALSPCLLLLLPLLPLSLRMA